jgi:hypothetical protein
MRGTKAIFSSASDHWSTPEDTYAALNNEFFFDFDPCPIGGTSNGLSTLFTPWHGRRVFCNPPYGPGIDKWLSRGLDAQVAVFLIPSRTDTRWFHDIVIPKASEIRFIRGRLKFGGSKNGAPFPSMVVIFGTTPARPISPDAAPPEKPRPGWSL